MRKSKNKVKIMPRISFDGSKGPMLAANIQTKADKRAELIDKFMRIIDAKKYSGYVLDLGAFFNNGKFSTMFLSFLEEFSKKMRRRKKELALTVFLHDNDAKTDNGLDEGLMSGTLKVYQKFFSKLIVMAYEHRSNKYGYKLAPIEWMEIHLQ